MPIPEGKLDVAEVARRLGRSIEQVRRYLREGKLCGERIGQQWFVEEEELRRWQARRADGAREERWRLFERVDKRREAIRARLGYDLDVSALMEEVRSREEP